MDSTRHQNDTLGQASVPAVNQYLQLAIEKHLDIDAICAEVALDKSLLSDNSQHISGLQFQQLIQSLISHSQDELFGLHTAKFVQPGSYSVLGYILMNCENLGQAIEKIQPFEKLVGDMGRTTIDNIDDKVKVSWHCRFTDPVVKRHMIDNCLASWLTFARYLVDNKSNPSTILLTREQPDLSQQTQYQAMFKCPIHYNQTENAIVFPISFLAVPLNKGDQRILPTLESHASELISNLQTTHSFDVQVSEAIKKNLIAGEFRQQHIAEIFQISTKTLQRRLRAENKSFQVVLDSTRLTIAKQLLTNSTENLNKISHQLGFNEPRSFYRWFNKLTSLTPGDYRRFKTKQ